MRATLVALVLTACARSGGPADTKASGGQPTTARIGSVEWSVDTSDADRWVPSFELAGPYRDLLAHDLEPTSASTGVRLVRRTADGARTRCHLALRTARGWYIAPDPIGPCDPADTELPGDTEIVGLERRDVIGGGDDEVVIDVEIRSTTPGRDYLSSSIVKRAVRATVVCSIDPSPPRCTGPIPYACKSQAFDDTPVDLLRRQRREPPVRAWLLAIRFPGDGTAVIPGAGDAACDPLGPRDGVLYLDL